MKVRKWIKSVLPPEDKYVGWIDMSNREAPVKKICIDNAWVIVGQHSYDEGYQEGAAIIDKFTITDVPIGVIEQTVDTTEGTVITVGSDNFIEIADFDIESTTNGDSYLFVYSSEPDLANFVEATNTSGVVSLTVIASSAQSSYEAKQIEGLGYVIALKAATLV